MRSLIRFAAAAAAGAVALASAPAAAVTRVAEPPVYICTDDTNVRSRPSTVSGDIIGTCWKGQRVRVSCYAIGQKVDNKPIWYKLHRANKVNWIHSGTAKKGDPRKGAPRC
ncbi:hypothetical protein AB0K48_13380 [Nonomuraea sp. NPDC055795]